MAAQNSTDAKTVLQQSGDRGGPAGDLLGDRQSLSGEDYLNSLPQNAAPLIPLIKGLAQGTISVPSDMRDPRLLQLIQMAGQYDPSLAVAGFTSRAAAAKNAPSDVQQGLNSQPGNLQPAQQPKSPAPSNSQGTKPDAETGDALPNPQKGRQLRAACSGFAFLRPGARRAILPREKLVI
ncbi:MAG: hypothetical protein WCA81_03805 [Rhizomicrobium sp.]